PAPHSTRDQRDRGKAVSRDEARGVTCTTPKSGAPDNGRPMRGADRLRERTGAAANLEPTRIFSQRQPRDELARRPPAPASHERFIGDSRCPHIVVPRVSHRHVVLPPLSRAYIYDLVPIEVGLRATALANPAVE